MCPEGCASQLTENTIAPIEEMEHAFQTDSACIRSSHHRYAGLHCGTGRASHPGPSRHDHGTGTDPAGAIFDPRPPKGTPLPALTNTRTVPEVRVSSATNCRTGPSVDYDLLWTMQPQAVAEVVGKHTPTGYWIIKYPGGQCWLWGQYALVSGNISGLPEYPQPRTPTPSKPAAPQNFKASTSCSPAPGPILGVQNLHVELTWTDVATNEEGYKISRNDTPLFTLSANSSSASDDTQIGGLFFFLTSMPSPTPFPGVKYSIRAFNGNGYSEWRELYANCP